ncbi:MAG: hypothetical protein KAW41_04445 [Candidatus Diapherotrites archaeon]|nr:hypothetical protein [Candidatus Diapherotrites archaeon]
MDFGAIYSQLEEKWYGLLDSLDEKGLPVYKLIDPIENAGIPSLPLVGGVLIVVIALIAYTMTAGVPGMAPGEFTITVVDTDGNPVKGALVTLEVDAEALYEATTNSKGEVYFDLDPSQRYQAVVESELCGSAIELIDTEEMDSLEIEMECVSPEFAGCSLLSEEKLVSQLADEQNNLPSACTMRVYNVLGEALDHPFEVGSDGLLDISEGGTCPDDDHRVLIDCQYHKWDGTVAGMYTELELFGYLTLAVKEDVQPETPDELPPVEITRDIYVKVQNTAGTPLEGISVKAVDALGMDLFVLLDGVELEGATDATGTARLVFPDQQEFHLQLDDPNGAYQPYTSASAYQATLTQSQNAIILNLATGYETLIYVKEEARQTAIAGATVTVSSESRVISQGTTGSDGIYAITLLKGMQYRVDVSHPHYSATYADIAGGVDHSVFMAPIDETKTGMVVVDVVSSTGLQEEFSGVRVQLYSEGNNTLWMTCISPVDGRCVFSRIKEGAYHLSATPPGAITAQSFPAFAVTAQNTTVQTLSVKPNQLTLTVLTEVQIIGTPVRKKDVEVTLWNADYSEPVETKESGSTRKVEFVMDQGTRYFLVAEYIDDQTGTKYGPLKTSPMRMSQNRKTTIRLTRVAEEVSVDAPREIAKGEEATVTLRLSLPEYRPNQPYDSASIEMFVGEPGGVQDIRKTPLVIQPIHLSDIASQEPFVGSITKADDYEYQSKPKTSDDGTSKYIKVTIDKYTRPTIYTVDIPVYARELAASGDVKISYRATWEAGGEEITSNEGLWSETSVKLTGEADVDNELETGNFYSYSAYFTKQLGKDAISEPLVPEGSKFYLHVNGKARSAITAWSVDVKNIPDKVEALSYSGKITRASGSTVNVAEFPLSGADFTISNSEEAYRLGKDDELELTVALRGTARGKGTLTVFSDYDNSMPYEVTRKARTGSTPIVGVTATLTAASSFCVPGYDNGLGDSSSCYFEYPEGMTLPTNNKKFKLTLELEGNATASVLFEAADSTIKFDETSANYYEATVAAPETMVISGYGSSLAQNTISVYIWESGTAQPTAPWAMVAYGPVDYSMQVTPFSLGAVETTISEATDELQIKIIRREGTVQTAMGADTLIDNQADVHAGRNRGKATLVLQAEPYFEFEVPADKPLQSEDGVKVIADSPLFGGLEYESEVSGLVFDPDYPVVLRNTFKLGETKPTTIKIFSSWKEAVSFELSDLEREGWDIVMTVKTHTGGSPSVLLETLSGADLNKAIAIPAEGWAEIIIAATARTAKCRLDIEPTILEIEVDKLPRPAHYTLELTCEVTGVEAPTRPLVTNFVSRETLTPERITMDSCSAAADGGYAFICDSEQLSVAIAKAADSLLQRPGSINDYKYYAFGNDEFSAAIMDEAVKENKEGIDKVANIYAKSAAALQSSTSDIVLTNTPSCGILLVNFTKINLDEDVNVSFDVITTGATWCQKNHPHYVIGLMNFDKLLRPDFGYFMSFAGEARLFLEAIQKSKEQGNDIDAALLFGYEPDDIEERSGSQAASFFNYQECERKETGKCPSYAVKRLSSEHPIIGYFHVTEQKDVLAGMVYDENRIVGAGGAYTQIPAYRAVYAKALLNYLITGESSGWEWDTGTFQSAMDPAFYPLADILLDLQGPTIIEESPDEFKLYGFDPEGTANHELVGTTDVNVELTVTGEPSFCIVSNLDASGAPLEEVTTDMLIDMGDDTYVLAIPWELPSGSGMKYVNAYCVDENGVPSHKVTDSIMLDDSAMTLIRPLPRLVTTHDTATMVPPTEGEYIWIRDRFSEVVYCELRADVLDMPNYEICDDDYDGIFDPTKDQTDDNANSVIKDGKPGALMGTDAEDGIMGYMDGCCYIPPEGRWADQHYQNAQVQCWSPYMEEEDAVTQVELWCRDAVGNEATLGTIDIFRYSSEKPEFSVPDDFIMGTNEDEDPLSRIFWFDNLDMPQALSGTKEWGDGFTMTPTAESDVFELGFTVTDMDGLDPASACAYSVVAHTESYTGKVEEENVFRWPTAAAATQTCEAEAVSAGSLRSLRVTCPIKLKQDAVNDVEITCTDMSEKKMATSKSFEWTWDETAPEILTDFEMNAWGRDGWDVNDPEKRDMAPTMKFSVKDDYSSIVNCEVHVNILGDVESYLLYKCGLSQVSRGLDTYMGATCDYRAETEDEYARWPVVLMNMQHPFHLSCYDQVGNRIVVDSSTRADMQLQAMDTGDVTDMAVKACELIRMDATPDQIQAAGFYDVGAEGSVTISDGTFLPDSTMDEDGVYSFVIMTDGEPSNEDIRNLHQKKLYHKTISRGNIDCASAGVCWTAIDVLINTMRAAKSLPPQAPGEPSEENREVNQEAGRERGNARQNDRVTWEDDIDDVTNPEQVSDDLGRDAMEWDDDFATIDYSDEVLIPDEIIPPGGGGLGGGLGGGATGGGLGAGAGGSLGPASGFTGPGGVLLLTGGASFGHTNAPFEQLSFMDTATGTFEEPSYETVALEMPMRLFAGGAVLRAMFEASKPAFWAIRAGAAGARLTGGILSATVQSKMEDYDTNLICDYSDKGESLWEGTGVVTEAAAAFLHPGILIFKVAVPDNYQALVCTSKYAEPASPSKPQRYVISARAGRTDLSSGGAMMGTLSVCADGCNDYLCIVTIQRDTVPVGGSLASKDPIAPLNTFKSWVTESAERAIPEEESSPEETTEEPSE